MGIRLGLLNPSAALHTGAALSSPHIPAKGGSVHAVVIRFKVNDQPALRSQVDEAIAEVSAGPGFVAAYWVALERDEGISFVVYESEHAAGMAAVAANVAEHSAITAGTPESGEGIAHA
jgi:hypothetical protein